MDTYRIYRRLRRLPGGRWAFARLYGRAAPYFATLGMEVLEMAPHRAAVTVPDRRAVRNHIGTVHALAIGNGLEAAMGLLAEATTAQGHRWIPVGMQLDYLAKASSDIHCLATSTPGDWPDSEGTARITVTATRSDGTVVVSGEIRLRVSRRPEQHDEPTRGRMT